jgi:hypothetical protein
MRISTRGRYALRAAVDLAQHGDQGPVRRRELSERQEISSDYIAQLFRCQGQVRIPQNRQLGIPQLKCSVGGLALLLQVGQLCEDTRFALLS